MMVFMKATDACILVGKVQFILAHSQGIFCKSNVFDNFAQMTLAPQRVRDADALHLYAVSSECHTTKTQTCFLYRLRVKNIFFSFFFLSLLHSCTFRIWCPHWSLIAMATSDFSCSLGPVLSLSNQNKTFVKIPSGFTYSTHYDELTLPLKGDRERTTARERFLQAIHLYWKKIK